MDGFSSLAHCSYYLQEPFMVTVQEMLEISAISSHQNTLFISFFCKCIKSVTTTANVLLKDDIGSTSLIRQTSKNTIKVTVVRFRVF